MRTADPFKRKNAVYFGWFLVFQLLISRTNKRIRHGSCVMRRRRLFFPERDTRVIVVSTVDDARAEIFTINPVDNAPSTVAS